MCVYAVGWALVTAEVLCAEHQNSLDAIVNVCACVCVGFYGAYKCYGLVRQTSGFITVSVSVSR